MGKSRGYPIPTGHHPVAEEAPAGAQFGSAARGGIGGVNWETKPLGKLEHTLPSFRVQLQTWAAGL